jgi:hypothetical protein
MGIDFDDRSPIANSEEDQRSIDHEMLANDVDREADRRRALEARGLGRNWSALRLDFTPWDAESRS